MKAFHPRVDRPLREPCPRVDVLRKPGVEGRCKAVSGAASEAAGGEAKWALRRNVQCIRAQGLNGSREFSARQYAKCDFRLRGTGDCIEPIRADDLDYMTKLSQLLDNG